MKILGYAAMVIALVIIVLPLYWIVMTSFKERPEIYTQPATWWAVVAASRKLFGSNHIGPVLDVLAELDSDHDDSVGGEVRSGDSQRPMGWCSCASRGRTSSFSASSPH